MLNIPTYVNMSQNNGKLDFNGQVDDPLTAFSKALDFCELKDVTTINLHVDFYIVGSRGWISYHAVKSCAVMSF